MPFLQTLCNAHDGINVFCIEPATHDRLPRKELRETGTLASTPRGGSHMFHLESFSTAAGSLLKVQFAGMEKFGKIQ
ncbi:hypothetical protein J2046_002520 [Rhizobium petrolearium]|uniref:hypothetical protein n=1 Tax=Neorhizobium petrolearium TaxID=515361 RepID=UPI001AE4C66F|nr:hypothetical protein [Neorhizobium petrolearium]MBP1844262.1 hypothetical protein [Neorhizobium petrolearium]